MSELNWIKHDGGPMPVPGHVQVLTRRKRSNRDRHPNAASWWDDKNPEDSNWSCSDESVRIVEYAIVSSAYDLGKQAAQIGNALSRQEGGSHYKDMAIQPVEYIMANNLGFCEGAIVKYVSRYKKKNGVEDLRKARHFIDMLIEREEKAQANG